MSGKRSFRLGLRKLLLWTAVAALFLGFLRMLELGLIDCVSLLFWTGMLRNLRRKFSFSVVALVAALSATV